VIGVIPAAGRGTRAYPYTQGIPKGMIDVAGRPNLERVMELMRDRLGIARVVIITGAFGDRIRTHFGSGDGFGVDITYVENDAVERGLGYSLLLARPFVDDFCCVVLSDECYVDSDHERLLTSSYRNCVATCAVQQTDAPELVERNYAVIADDDRARRLIEKPAQTHDALMGLGTFVLRRDFFDHLHEAVHRGRLASDPVSLMDRLCQAGERVGVVRLAGQYVNINDRDALNRAAIAVRSREFGSRSRGLALLMKGSADDTRRSIREFRCARSFNEMVLVAPPGVDAPVETDVRVVRAVSARYGDLMRAGFDALGTDILMCAHSDGSCRPRDAPKFFEYLKEADIVVGTRTTRQLIEQGTHMRGSVRLAHIVLAKFLELVWWGYEPRFTDVGCSYRAVWRSTYEMLRNQLRCSGPEYAAELYVEALRSRRVIIEIPVSFAVRRKAVREPDQRLTTFFSIAALIVRRRMNA